MTVVWEDPPPGAPRGARFGREPSPLRKEVNELLAALREKPGAWARLYDMDSKEDARKRASFVQQKGYNLSVRETAQGWSVFARYPEPATDEPETASDDTATVVADDEPSREPTFG